MSTRRRLIIFFVPVPFVLLLLLLEALGVTQRAGDRLYDLALRWKAPPPVAPELLQIDIDEQEVAATDPWPWSRDVFADGLTLLTEFDAGIVVFDTLFAHKAPLGVDRVKLRDELPQDFMTEFQRIEGNVQSLFDGIRRGSIRAQESEWYVSQLLRLIAESRLRLLDGLTEVERDNDLYLGQALRFHGAVFVPIEILHPSEASVLTYEETLRLEQYAVANLSGAPREEEAVRGLRLPVLTIADAARGGGFRDEEPDADGVVRRARLVATYGGKVLGQVAFAALLDYLNSPAVELSGDKLVLRGARTVSRAPRDLEIPLTGNGRPLISWPRPAKGSAIRHLDWQQLLRHQKLEESLIALVRAMDDAGFLGYLFGDQSILELYRQTQELRERVLDRTADVREWREARSHFFGVLEGFLSGDAEGKIVDDAKRALASAVLAAEDRQAIRRVLDSAPVLFGDARSTLRELTRLRAELAQSLAGSFCVIALSGSSQETIGRTPFGQEVSAADASVAAVNTILTAQPLREVPRWYVAAVAALLCLLTPLVYLRLRPAAAALSGLAAGVVVLALSAALLALRSSWADPTAVAGGLLLSSLGNAAMKLRRESD